MSIQTAITYRTDKAWTFPIIMELVSCSDRLYLFTSKTECTIIADATEPDKVGRHYKMADIDCGDYKLFKGSIRLSNNI